MELIHNLGPCLFHVQEPCTEKQVKENVVLIATQ